MSKECKNCSANSQEILKLRHDQSPTGINELSSHQKAELFAYCKAVVDCDCWKALTEPRGELVYVSTSEMLSIAERELEDSYLR